ncbi:MAG: class I SAM-dependent methyltransferase [Desulfarculaceae bacterium]|jgi:SAM-dependent methyltransferase
MSKRQENDEQTAAAYAYAESFVPPDKAAKHAAKFDKRVDNLRHQIEVSLLNRYVKGSLFDCTIGFGRLVGELTEVTSYQGMDYSPAFVESVRQNHPQVSVMQGDLLKGINQEADRFDTVICLRTLPALPASDRIISDMVRITRPGGLIVFDYGTRPKKGEIGGVTTTFNTMSVKQVAADLPVKLMASHRLDSPLLLAVKKNDFLNRWFHVRFNILSDRFYMWLDRFLTGFKADRRLYVFKKTS